MPDEFLDSLDVEKRANMWRELIHHSVLGPSNVIVKLLYAQVFGHSSNRRGQSSTFTWAAPNKNREPIATASAGSAFLLPAAAQAWRYAPVGLIQS